VTRAAVAPRTLHPGAWWLWAVLLATAATRTTNPLLLGLVIAVAGYVVAARRVTSAPWSRAFHAALVLGAIIVGVRLVFEVLFGVVDGPTVLFTLPTVPLPSWAAGVTIGGAVTVEGLVIGACQALQVATLVACFGAANALANPTRLLKTVPGALYEMGVAVIVSLTLVPQAVADVRRVRQARRLRGRPDRGVRAFVGVGRAVLDGAFDRSLSLAASMDARGYGRRNDVPARTRRLTAACVLGGLVGVACGVYGLLDAGSPGWIGLPLLLAGLVLATLGTAVAGRRASRTRYRPDPWRAPEWLTVASGAVPAVVLVATGINDPTVLQGPGIPLTWPTLPLIPAAALLVALLPAFATPPQEAPVRTADAAPRRSIAREEVAA
jgi:energy-coupling factor transport system permease protein